MTWINITLDSWAFNNSTIIATIIIQSICLLISLIILIIRSYQIYQKLEMLKQGWKYVALPLTQWIMIVLSCFYLSFHEWNYIHLYLPSNPLDCGFWVEWLLTCFVSTRIFLFIFLMLRSSLSFERSFCNVSLKISIPMVIFTILSNMIPLPLILTHFIPIQPYPDKGFCFRIYGKTADDSFASVNLLNCVGSFAALVLFYWKSRLVRRSFAGLEKKGEMNAGLVDLDFQFRKHTNLGILTVIGTILIFFIGEMLSILMGMAAALDQVVNNILTFMMFKENGIMYEWLLCKCGKGKHEKNVINLTEMQVTTGSNSSNSTITKSGLPTVIIT